MGVTEIAEQIGKFIIFIYFLDYIISPHACEILRIKNLIFAERMRDFDPEDKPSIKYEIGESIHWVAGRITQGLILFGCLFTTKGSPYVEIGILYLLLNLVFEHTENASLRDAFYRLISMVAISILVLSEDRLLLGLASIFQ